MKICINCNHNEAMRQFPCNSSGGHFFQERPEIVTDNTQTEKLLGFDVVIDESVPPNVVKVRANISKDQLQLAAGIVELRAENERLKKQLDIAMEALGHYADESHQGFRRECRGNREFCEVARQAIEDAESVK